ncbi:unnamed protein product [Gongylonema pulchrum]|uniref:P-type conjugative transfer protein TrbJ n=1 Tax=Gongylonema pulchrum TaxID=637853 RepID=A0A183EXY9_9BILA|nr:unnamed protein product [Gongylonema pulchrum]
MTAAMRAQALVASQAEHQRQFALAMMRGDVTQAQMIRARFLSQQAAALGAFPNLPMNSHPQHVCFSCFFFCFCQISRKYFTVK